MGPTLESAQGQAPGQGSLGHLCHARLSPASPRRPQAGLSPSFPRETLPSSPIRRPWQLCLRLSTPTPRCPVSRPSEGGREGTGKDQAGRLPAESWRRPCLHLPLQAVGSGEHPLRGYQRASAEVHSEPAGTGREVSSGLVLCSTGSWKQVSPFVSAVFPKERPPARHQDGRA